MDPNYAFLLIQYILCSLQIYLIIALKQNVSYLLMLKNKLQIKTESELFYESALDKVLKIVCYKEKKL
jgi:hypothetical protein